MFSMSRLQSGYLEGLEQIDGEEWREGGPNPAAGQPPVGSEKHILTLDYHLSIDGHGETRTSDR